MSKIKVVIAVQLGIILTLLAVISLMFTELRERVEIIEVNEHTTEALDYYRYLEEEFGSISNFERMVELVSEVVIACEDYFDNGNTEYESLKQFIEVNYPELYAEMEELENQLDEIGVIT